VVGRPRSSDKGPRVTRFVVLRLAQAIPTLIGILVLTFALIKLAPADPVTFLMPPDALVTAGDRETLRTALGLNDPMPVQLARWVWNALRLDFGNSFFSGEPVRRMIVDRLPNTLILAAAALVLSVLLGVPLGVLAALKRGKVTDHVIRTVSVIGHAVPTFWFGLLFIVVFGGELRWFPVGGLASPGREADVLDRLRHLVGPVLTLALAGIANYPRYLRTEILEIVAQDYVRTARAKGLAPRRVMIAHVVRNSLLPLVTLIGAAFATFLSGAVVVEQVFGWPGMGRLIYDAAGQKDYPVVQAAVLMSATMLLIANILRDVTYALVDPRVRIGR
jgi:peptide/nickel transport system permease protein